MSVIPRGIFWSCNSGSEPTRGTRACTDHGVKEILLTIQLSPDTRKQIIASLQRYFAENMDEEIGDLQADLLLDYVLGEIGPTVYNRAIADFKGVFSPQDGRSRRYLL